EVKRIDRLNVEDVLRVVGAANVKVRIVLKGDADQIGDGVLRRLAQVLSLLGITHRCRDQENRHRCDSEGSYKTLMRKVHRWLPPLLSIGRSRHAKTSGTSEQYHLWRSRADA